MICARDVSTEYTHILMEAEMRTVNMLVRERLKLTSTIVHSRLMIKCNYHPEFFKRKLIKQQLEQRNLLREERELASE